ncbi:unnamed protein product [Thlaspi arvense]|uniref:Transmembrane protein n=1 Tax=Thlaspi arvense TaxID=13288 RepID=A0AAU9T634_THLAR|nr:unnamed protein product [Thlaspi arvense]
MSTLLGFFCSLIIIILLLSQPLPISSENQENEAQTVTSLGRRLVQHGDSNPSDHLYTLRVFMRKGRSGGGGGRGGKSRRRVPSTGGSGGGSSATTRLCLSITFRVGSTLASSILLIFFTF